MRVCMHVRMRVCMCMCACVCVHAFLQSWESYVLYKTNILHSYYSLLNTVGVKKVMFVIVHT